MSIRYYDKQGKPITMYQWASTLADERRVALDILPNGARVSTVWLGMDHSFNNSDTPKIFETMVFDYAEADGEQERYSTLEEAMAGHKRMVEKWTA